jgi:hypothetical protein
MSNNIGVQTRPIFENNIKHPKILTNSLAYFKIVFPSL